MVRARNARNTPFPASWAKNDAAGPSPPPPPPCGMATRSPMPRITGSTTSTPSRARLRQRRKIRRSSEPSRRSQVRTPLRGRACPASCRARTRRGVPAGSATAQPSTSNPSPVSPTNSSSRLGPRRVQPGHRRRRRRPARGRSVRAPDRRARGLTSPSAAGTSASPSLAEDAVGLGWRPSVRDPDPGRAAGSAAPPAVPWKTSRPVRITPDLGADLLDLGEQVRGDQDGDAVGGDLPDQATDLAGALRVEAVGGLVQDDQLPRPEQAGRDGQPLLHAQRVGPVALLGRGEQADPVQRRVDPGRRGARVGGPVGGVHPGQVGPAGQLRVEGGPLDQRADPRQHPGGRPRASARRAG